MPTVMDRETLHVSSDQAEAARRTVSGSPGGGTPVLGFVQDEEFVALPEALQPLLHHIVEAVAEGRRISVGELPEELTTTLAAEMLGVSRPTLMKRVRAGEIAAHKVGSHTRLRSEDVLSILRDEAQERRQDFDDARHAQDDAGLIA